MCNFNPRPREEGDAIESAYKAVGDDFNPRPREEGDRFIVYIITYLRISIHALVKRATAREEKNNDRQDISIHALVKRATYYDSNTNPIRNHFNPRPREEGDLSYIV